jgi:YYY domain-containing protein
MLRKLVTPGRLLAIILCVAAGLRFYGIEWDSRAGQHPDERHVTNTMGRLSWPKTWGDYFSESASPLNPRNYEGGHFWAYGTLPTTVLRAVVDLGGVTKPEDTLLFGRGLSTLADLGVVLLLFLLAQNLYRDRRIALLAAFLYAIAVLPIQEAHFFVVDPMANLFVMLAMWLLARAWRSGRWLDYGWVGIAIGLAFSCKISAAAFGLPMGLVALLPAAGRPCEGKWSTLGTATLRCAVFLVAAFLTVHVAMPDAFAGIFELAPRWLKNMREVVAISTGQVDIPYTRQWVNRIPLAWPWWNMVAWGMGLPLGLTAWLAWLGAGWQLIVRRVWTHLIPVAWIATVFITQGLIYQATLRYFLPIYGALILLAAWMLVRGVDLARAAEKSGRPRRWLRGAAFAAPVLVAAGTLVWALGFVSIYRQPHTRVEASRWIYEHIPPGSTLACEVWDDFLPLPLPGTPGPGIYHQIEMPLYLVDDPGKRGQLLALLNRAEYIVIASQKLTDSIPRMPHRYPFTISYYEGLRDGSLGFDEVAEFSRSMNVLGFPISTRSAEEAFSVYDHPPVTIYRKSPRYDPDALVMRFNSIPLADVSDTRYPEKKALARVRRAERVRNAPTEAALLLPAERWARDQERGTWREIFNRESFAARHSTLVWSAHLLLLQILGLALAFPLFRRLPDRGAALARPFAILFPLWALWFLASVGLTTFTRGHYWMTLGVFGLIAAWSVYRHRAEWPGWLRGEVRTIGLSELVFWTAFAGFLIVRAFNPDLWHPAWGGEKPMEMTYLYGVLRSEEFPPLNPWFSGGFINYYYFGFVLCGGLIKGLGVLPEVGFNLCLATFFGLTAAGAFGAARALTPTRALWPAWAATAFVALFGNLFQIRFIWNRFVLLGTPDHEFSFPIFSDVVRAGFGVKRYLAGQPLSPYIADLYWVAARAIGEGGPGTVQPITEFPYWSFLYGDLHPHVIALPFTLAVITLLVAWVKTTGALAKGGLILLLGFTLGFFWPTNSWDWPTYGALTGLTLFLAAWRRDQVGTVSGFVRAMITSLVVFGLMLAIGYFAFRPFHQHYLPGYGAFEWWTGERTSLRDYVFIHGFFLFVLGTGFIVTLRARGTGLLRIAQAWILLLRQSLPGGSRRRQRRLIALAARHRFSFAISAVLLTAMYVLLVVAAAWQTLPPLLLLGFLSSLVLAVSWRQDVLRALPALMTALGFLLSLLVEYVVLAGDVGRMNTVFKFYYQVWIFFALASALTLPAIFGALRSWKSAWRRTWVAAFAVLVGLSLLFVVTGTPQKIRDRFAPTPPTLDGLAFANVAEYSLRGHNFRLQPDLLAIRWLQDHIAGTPVILEMNLDRTLYSWGNRFSTHTGLPAITGWSWHQRQQQAALRENHVDDRIAEIQRIYATTDLAEARQLLDRYQVGLVVVGELERIYAPAEGLAKFDKMGLQKIYDVEGVAIYRVPR